MTAILKDSQLLVGRAIGAKFYRENQTEPYVESPPALIITYADGSTFSLGYEYLQVGQAFEWNVLRNDVSTGEFASRIVYQRGKVRIFGRDGWRTWTGKGFI